MSEDDQIELINILSIPYQRASSTKKKEKSEGNSTTPKKSSSSNSTSKLSSGQVLSSSSSTSRKKTSAEIAEIYEKRAAMQKLAKSGQDVLYASQERSYDSSNLERKNDFEPLKETEKRKQMGKFEEIKSEVKEHSKSSSFKADKSSPEGDKRKKYDSIDPIILDDDDDKKNDEVSSTKVFKRTKRVERESDSDSNDDEDFETRKKKQRSSFLSSSKSSQPKQRSSVHVDADGTMINSLSSSSGKSANTARYSKMSISELKDVLRANGQLLSGTKQELVDRCVDGELNGRLPKCPACIKGTLHFDSKRNCIACSGYYDTDISARISCKYSAGSIKRLPWLHSADEAAAAAEQESSSSKTNDQHKLRPEDITKLIELKKVSAKETAAFLLKKAREYQLSLPSDESQARLAIGGILMAATDSSGEFDPQNTMNEIAEKYPSNETKLDTMPQAKRTENSALAHAFDELAKKEKNAGGEFSMFKAKAAKQAAIIVRDLDFTVTSGKALAQGKSKVPGIGKGTAAYIDEFLQTGTFARLNEL